MDLRDSLRLNLTALLTIALAFIVRQSLTSPVEIIEDSFHVSWTDNGLKYDFLFSYKPPLKNLLQFEPLKSSNLYSVCTGHAACLKYGTFIQPYYFDSKKGNIHVFKANSTSVNQTGCNNSVVSIHNYCSTHWNSPVHLIGDGNCSHTFEWHTPYTCDHQTTANYERPCYTYDSAGQLYDLTDWILSNGSSYKIDTGLYNSSIKQFNLNVCNDAPDPCGHNLSSCYTNDKGSVESGYINSTSIKYDEKENAVLLTSLGEHNEKCPDKRIRTVVRFICNNRLVKHTKPKLIKSNPCENIIEWKTIHACPVSDTKVKALNCAIKYEPLGIEINLKNLTNNVTTIEMKNITLEGKQKNMMISLCEGMKSLNCEGKDRSSTTACLIDADTNSTALTANNSQVVGIVMGSFIRLANNRLYWESSAKNKTCQFHSGNFNITRNIGTRIEFFCSPQSANKPTFLGYQDCVFVFEWGSEQMCLEDADNPKILNITTATPTKTQIISPSSSTPIPPANSNLKVVTEGLGMKQKQLSDKELKIDINERNKSAQEMHNENINEVNKIIVETSKQAPKIINDKPVDIEAKKAAPVVVPANQTSGKMNSLHKFFMISLILMSLIGFIVTIFILDRKTQFKLPLGNIRRQASRAFEPQPVPYTRVNDFNDSLDL